jgi:hypothetical protein
MAGIIAARDQAGNKNGSHGGGIEAFEAVFIDHGCHRALSALRDRPHHAAHAVDHYVSIGSQYDGGEHNTEANDRAYIQDRSSVE